MSVAIVSSVYGGYDPIRLPVLQNWECEYILVTDHERATSCLPWQVIVEPRASVPDRLASRVAKCNPWLYTDAEIVIWIDGNIEITSPGFVEWCLESLGDGMLCQRNLARPDIMDEVKASFRYSKWGNDQLNEMVAHYLSTGYQSNYGIWWCGFMVMRREFQRRFPAFGNKWLAEMVRWTCQDQMSYSYLLHKIQVKPRNMAVRFGTITDPNHDNTWCEAEHFTLHKHPDSI